MDNDLPTLPRVVFGASDNSLPYNPTRKRVHASSFATPSSDPAFFSSDDNPDADNYGRERKKTKFRGPWYQQVMQTEHELQGSTEHHPPRKTERKFERKYDSGVYMHSDGTDYEESMLEGAIVAGREATEFMLPSRKAVLPVSPMEIWVQGQIHKCLEDGNERIDLSSMGISTITNATIRPLSTFTIIPPVSQDVFQHLEPNLKIFLSSNHLTTLPEELFRLNRLTALSLRGNSIRELPPAIGSLSNLKELNISLNQLEYLPFEFLDLFTEESHLTSLSIHPNPFVQPEEPPPTLPQTNDHNHDADSDIDSRPMPINMPRRKAMTYSHRRSWNTQWKVSFQCRTEIRYFDKHGTLVKGPDFGRRHDGQLDGINYPIPTADITIAPTPPTSTGAFSSRAPSLVELALKSCLQTPQPSQLLSLLPLDTPEHVQGLLEQVVAQKESGVGNCTVCKRAFVVKRTEWFEWWEVALVHDGGKTSAVRNERDSFESRVPFVRRGCSWFCVPEKAEVVDDEEERSCEDAFAAI